MRSFAFSQEIIDNFIIQPPSLEASQIFLEFSRLGLPGYQCFYPWPGWQLSLRVSEDALAACGTVGSDPGSVCGVGHFHKGGGEENLEVFREKLPWDSHHATGVRAVVH